MSVIIPRFVSLNTGSFTFKKLSPNGRDLVALTATEASLARARFFQVVQREISARSMISGPKMDEYVHPFSGALRKVRSGYRYEEGANPPRPTPVKDTYDEKIVVKNGNFHKRRKNGEIVYAPYTIKSGIVLHEPGVSDVISDTVRAPMETLQFTSLYSLQLVPLVGKQMFWSEVGFFLTSWNDSNLSVLDEKHGIVYSMPSTLGFNGSARMFCDIAGQHVKDVGLITAANADANKGSIDTLTAIGELPETIRSIVGGLAALGTIIKDFRKGKFRLTTAHVRSFNLIGSDFRSKRLALVTEYNQKLARAHSHRWPEAAIRNLTDRHNKKLAGLAKLEKDTKIRATKEFTTAVTKLWLTVRYGILPVVYTFEDYLDYRDMLFASYVTTRKRRNYNIKLPSYEGFELQTSLNNQAHRVWIKRRLNEAMDRKSAQLQHTNILSTAWELIPLSFVADWFVNFGDFITSKGSLETYWAEGATYSVKGDIDVYYVHKKTGARVSVLARNYTRETINPCELSGLTFQYNLNTFRYLDAVSLSWGTVRRKI